MALHPEQAALLLAAFAVAILAWRLPRAALWIAAAAASFAASTAWGRFGLPHAAWFTGMCDASVCLAIYFFGRQQWEMRLYNLFQLSVLWSLGYLAGAIGPHWVYVVGLEAINWAALLLIATTTVVTSGVGDALRAGRHAERGIRWAQRALRQERTVPPWPQR